MMPYYSFKEKLFPILVKMYNEKDDFETSKFDKIFVALLS